MIKKLGISLLCLNAALAYAEDPDKIVLENFEGKYEWEGGNERGGKRDYNVLADAQGNHFLQAQFIADTEGKMVQRRIDWDSEKMPMLSWRWRVDKFPKGAKIQEEGKIDAAAQVYVVWRMRGRVHGIKYYWSESDPVDTHFTVGKNNPFGVYEAVVLRMGGKTGEWHTEKRNIREDFKKFFGKDPSTDARGIGILTDGDGTKTQPEAAFDDFVVSKK